MMSDEKKEDESPEGSFVSKLLGLLQPVIELPIKAGTSVWPVYVVGFAIFLLGRDKKFTEDDLSRSYQIALAGMAKYAVKKYNGVVGGGDRAAYKDKYPQMSAYMGESSPGSPLIGKSDVVKSSGLVEDYMYFLGQFTAKELDDYYLIEDFYDFNNFKNDTNFFSKVTNAWGEFKSAVSVIAKKKSARSVYDLVRKMATFRHGTGYKGFPLRIKVPKEFAPRNDP